MWRCFVTCCLRERLVFAGCLLLVSTTGLPSLRAQDTPVVSGSAPSVTAKRSSAVPTSTASTERLLLLQNGKVVKGVIRKNSAGYVVNVTGGQLVLPFEQVRFEAADLEEVYRQQRDTLPDQSAAAHIELARWCVGNGMPDQASTERSSIPCPRRSTRSTSW